MKPQNGQSTVFSAMRRKEKLVKNLLEYGPSAELVRKKFTSPKDAAQYAREIGHDVRVELNGQVVWISWITGKARKDR